MTDPGHIALLKAVARHFFGEPNERLSSKHELRFGTNGSKSVDLRKGTWFDHEAKNGGGPLDLIRCKTGITELRECYKWAEHEGYWRNGATKPKRTIVASYNYTAVDGELIFQVVRYEPKDFRQRRPNGSGWTWSVKGVRQVPYRLPEIAEAIANDHVIAIVEGEKDADRLWSLGFPATCNAGGANKWHDDLTPHFKDADVVIIADNDDPGRGHAAYVASKLTDTAKRVRVLDLATAWHECPEKADISDWFDKAGGTIEDLYEITQHVPDWQPVAAGWSFHQSTEPAPTRWAIKGFLPETGAGLLSGQWGTYKSTIALSISFAIMALEMFAGRFRVKRRGGVVYFAAEGNAGIASRLTAIAHEHGYNEPLPFAHRADCPKLSDPDAAEQMAGMVKEAGAALKREFGVDVVLIAIDTLIATAGYKKAGDENDAALGMAIRQTMVSLSQKIGAVVLALDHFGKEAETGTRGTSAKEDNADFVFAAIGTKELTGAITNTALAIRKQKEGEAGIVLPFTPIIREVGHDPDGDPITRVIIEWAEPSAAPWVSKAKKEKDPWAKKSLRLLRQTLMSVLVEHGKEVRPWHDGPSVRAVDLEVVRSEFYRGYPAIEESDPKRKQGAKQRALHRAITAASAGDLVKTWEIEGTTYVWLVDKAPIQT